MDFPVHIFAENFLPCENPREFAKPFLDMGRPDTPYLIAYDFLKNNPKTTIGEAIRALGVSQFTVSKARRKLVEEGVLTKWSTTAHRLSRRRETLHVAAQASDEPMTAEQLHRVLSKSAREARDGAELRPIAAELIKLLPKPESGEEQIGPGEPMTEEDKIERGGLVLKALGADLSVRAVEWARASHHPEGMGPEEPSADNAAPV